MAPYGDQELEADNAHPYPVPIEEAKQIHNHPASPRFDLIVNGYMTESMREEFAAQRALKRRPSLLDKMSGFILGPQ